LKEKNDSNYKINKFIKVLKNMMWHVLQKRKELLKEVGKEMDIDLT